MDPVRLRVPLHLLAHPGLVRLLKRLVVGGLLGLHAWLLGAQLLSGDLFTPAVLLRWGLGLVLAGAIFALGRFGRHSARKATVLWTLVGLLHWHASQSGLPAEAGVQAEVAGTVIASVIGAALGALLLEGIPPRRRRPAPVAHGWYRSFLPPTEVRYSSRADLVVLGCRPPPARLC